MAGEQKPFRFLTQAEFEALSSSLKLDYLRRATAALQERNEAPNLFAPAGATQRSHEPPTVNREQEGITDAEKGQREDMQGGIQRKQ